MIRIVGYLDTRTESQRGKGELRWFTIWESPPNLSSSRALRQAASRMTTWEKRLERGSFEGVQRVALEAIGTPTDSAPTPTGFDALFTVRVLEVFAGHQLP